MAERSRLRGCLFVNSKFQTVSIGELVTSSGSDKASIDILQFAINRD